MPLYVTRSLIGLIVKIHTELATKYEVHGYPTLTWFKNGHGTEYPGGRTTSEIVAFIRKKAGAPTALITTTAELDNLLVVC